MDSNLPFEILGKIWDLADIDKDGKLNQHEFIIVSNIYYIYSHIIKKKR
jgi:epidermal growth factor receptor substrate 15